MGFGGKQFQEIDRSANSESPRIEEEFEYNTSQEYEEDEDEEYEDITEDSEEEIDPESEEY